MNELERKQWLEDHKDEIYKYCLQSEENDYKLLEYPEDVARCCLKRSQEEINSNAKALYEILMSDYKTKDSECKECVEDINISSYLESIRHNKYESMMCLIIKDNKIVDQIIEKGGLAHCDPNNKTMIKGFELAKKLNGNLYIVHNHPYKFAATPSGYLMKLKNGFEMWIGDKNSMYEKIPEFETKYNVKVIDYGIVTETDYYSAKQKKDLSK